ncbi:MAG TPA: ABC transporter ATP-binding protein [bacterium]|nr:ABC transporter ATP-binding protein [bacterium]
MIASHEPRTPLLQTRGLTKRFGSFAALDAVDLDIQPGEIHSILGENGAGKTTLMNLLFGIHHPDAGTILWKGAEAHIDSPADARRRGIGMVHQHFMLAPALTVAENVLLAHPDRAHFLLNRGEARRRVVEISERHGLALDPEARVETLPVGARQRVEIAKAIAHQAELLILDEPTAVLTPKEASDLFRFLRELREREAAVVFISHKMDEVLEISDRVTVLRRGRFAGSFARGEATAATLAGAVLGVGEERRTPIHPKPSTHIAKTVALTLRGLSARFPNGTALHDIDLELHEGEIFAVAGVDGNGQEEWTSILAGVTPPDSGSIFLAEEDVTAKNALERHELGLGVLPGDRARQGLVLDLAIWENLVLRRYGAREARRGRLWIDLETHRRDAAHLLEAFDVRGPGLDAKARSLSGGNQQKVLLAREIGRGPRVLVALHATRGLDIGASADVVRRTTQLRDAGAGILWISTDLDEVLEIGDRVGVLVGGRLREMQDRSHEAVGAAMLTAEAPAP